LTWPAGWPRSKFSGRHREDYSNPISVGDGCERVVDELRKLNASDVVISSNLRARLDGLPYSGQGEPKDAGIAVYFTLKNCPAVLACDRWNRAGRNLWAIAKHVEALRGQNRWGVGSIEQAFAGYARLPGPVQTSGLKWWEELGVEIGADAESIKAAYRAQAKVRHPDAGGTQEAMSRLNESLRMALDQNGRVER
jgi:hypothetical protein